MSDFPSLVATLMQSRQTILPKRLVAPGTDASQLDMILVPQPVRLTMDELLPCDSSLFRQTPGACWPSSL